MISRRLFTCAALGFGLTAVSTLTATAGDEKLYEGVFHPDSSFVRIVAPDQAFAVINEVSLRDFETGVSSYVNVMPGQVEVVLPTASLVFEADPATHYTILMAEGADPTVLKDDLTLSPSRADVTVYNLSDVEDLNLFVPAAKAVAIAGIAPAHGQSVALKAPLTLDFDLRSGEDTIASVAQVGLERKAGMSFLVMQGEGGYSALAVPNRYLR